MIQSLVLGAGVPNVVEKFARNADLIYIDPRSATGTEVTVGVQVVTRRSKKRNPKVKK